MIKINLIIAAMLALPLLAMGQDDKRVAILEVVDKESNVDYGPEMILRMNLSDAINKTDGYQAFTRVNLKEIFGEQNFQRSGAVSDAQIRKMGELYGVDYILIAEATKYSDFQIVVGAQLISVVEGRITNSTLGEVVAFGDPDEMKRVTLQIAGQLLGTEANRSTGNGSRGSSSSTFSRPGQDLTETAYGLNLRMVYVEGGTFTMGSTSEQGGEAYSDESPIRQVTVGPFYMGMLEVTQGQWEKVMGTGISQQRNKADPSWTLSGVGPDYPMYYVSWEEAKEFCLRLSRQSGKTYRLPTEAEWEYAARGGRKNEGTKYSGGWNLDDVGWYTGNSGSSTHVCGTKRSNALGLYDMSGNVWEWCEDWYGPYLSYDTDNPRGASQGSNRVYRGGSWGFNAGFCRVSSRGSGTPSSRYNNLGFRVVLVP